MKHTVKFQNGKMFLNKSFETIYQRTELPITKESIYDEMCRLLTDYEDMNGVTEVDLYNMLVKIQNNWEAVITVQEG